jgi:hypothetical protein
LIGSAKGRITHIHANFEINFEPTIFKLYAIEEMKKVGFV